MGVVKGSREAEFMHQLGGWFHSLELGTLLSRMARVDDGLRGKKPRNKKPNTSPKPREVVSIPEAGFYIGQAALRLETLYSSPLNMELEPAIREKMLVVLALDSIGALPKYQAMSKKDIEDLKVQLEPLAEMQVVRVTGIHKIKVEEDQDQATREVISEHTQQFVSTVKFDEGSFTRWVIQGTLQSHYTHLGTVTGVLDPVEYAASKAIEFSQVTHQYPGFGSNKLGSDIVPGRFFGFERYNRLQWKRRLVEQQLSSTSLYDLLLDAREYWGAFNNGSSNNQQQRVPYSRFYKDSKFRMNPLIIYYPGILWISPKYDWVAELNFEDLAMLGSWSAGITAARYFGDNTVGLDLIDKFVKSDGSLELIKLIRTNELDRLQEPKSA
jgi:hypothetical protein